MHSQKYIGILGSALLGTALALTTTSVNAIDFIEEFDGAMLDTAVWQATGSKTASLAGGHLQIANDGGNWNRYSIRSEQRFFVPEVGETSIFEWELAPASITTDMGQSIRIQVGIVSDNDTDPNPEHYWTTAGGLWLDLDNIQSSDATTVSGNTLHANDTKTAGSNGTFLDGVTVPWNWQTENTTLRLELTNDTYKWFNGDTQLSEHSLADAGIDAEFSNGFRIVALGMNYNSGRGTTAFERIAVTNGQGPSALLESLSSSPPVVFSGQNYTLAWQIDADASGSMDQEIGNIDTETVNGAGALDFIAPDVDVLTPITYNFTATKAGQNSVTRPITVNVKPAPELSLENLSDNFSSNFIDPETWIESGPIGNSIDTGIVTWDTAGGGDWAHGELDTQKVFPIPPAGSTTTITWNLGKATVSANSVNDEQRGNRLVMGIVSPFETETYTLQHYQNTSGGLWMDIANMSNANTTGVSGEFHYANDTKPKNENAPVLGGFAITDWNWQADDREFSLVLSDTGYTWMDGATELAFGTYANAGIDLTPGGEFSKGFRVIYASVKYQDGSGTMSLNSINVDNGGVAPGGPPEISSIVDNGDGTFSLTWSSKPSFEYAIQTSDTLEGNSWEELTRGIIADGPTKTLAVSKNGGKLFYRVVEL